MRVKSVLRNLLTTQTSTVWTCTSRNQVRLTNCSKSNKTIFQMSKRNFQSKSKNFVTVGTYRTEKPICRKSKHNLMFMQMQWPTEGNRNTKNCKSRWNNCNVTKSCISCKSKTMPLLKVLRRNISKWRTARKTFLQDCKMPTSTYLHTWQQ